MNKDFRPYTHVQRYGTDETEGILDSGTCYVFPKLDGTNGSVWWNGKRVCAGSRKKHLTRSTQDNAGFYAYVSADARFEDFFAKYPNLRLYGEWLVPHTLKTYWNDAWRQFYVFDVFDEDQERYIPFEKYESCLEEFKLSMIPAYGKFNCTGPLGEEELKRYLESNTFLLREGIGEGIVLKNYSFINKYGRLAYAKVISSTFLDRKVEISKPKKAVADGEAVKIDTEAEIVRRFLSKDIVDKVHAKIVNEEGEWRGNLIPRLLHTSYHDFITEEIWEILQSMKNVTIDFGRLKFLAVDQIKQHAHYVFGGV